MILGGLLFLAANAAILLGAHELLRKVRTGEPAVDMLLFLLLRFLLVSAVVLAAGVTGTLTPWGLGIPGLAALSVLLWSGAHRRLPRCPLPRTERWVEVLTLVVVARLVLQVWFFTPHLGDPLAYHLPKIGEWIRSGGFTRELGNHPHVTFPAGFELLETWWVVFLRHDVFIEMAGVEFLGLAFAATASLARAVGLSSRAAWFAGLTYILTQGLHLSATSCVNDAPVAALVVTTLALVAWQVPLPLIVVAAGLGLGIKATFVYALPGAGLLWILGRGDPRRPCAGRRLAAGLAVLAVLVGGFWYGRNAVTYGNPVYPVGEPGYAQERVAVQVGASAASLWGNAIDLINTRIYDDRCAYGANVDDISGWGVTTFACGLVALFLAALEDRASRRMLLAFTVSLGSCFILMIHDPWSLKYVFFFPAVAAVAIARLRETQKAVLLLSAAGVIVSLLTTFLPYDLPWDHFRRLAAQPWRTRSALPAAENALLENPIACVGYGGNAYHLYGAGFERAVVYLRPRTSSELADLLRKSGCRRIYVVPVTPAEHELLGECLRDGRLKRVGEGFYELN